MEISAKLKSFPIVNSVLSIKKEDVTSRLDIKTLIIGLCLIGVFYLSIYIYILLNASSTLSTLEERLAKSTVFIEVIKPHEKEDVTLVKQHETVEIDHIKMDDLMIEGLYQKSQHGYLPVVRQSDYLTPFRAYSEPYSFNNSNSKPFISFVIKDYGLSKSNSKTALDLLPKEVSFILSTEHMPKEWTSLAIEKGHEVWLNLPIQNDETKNNGRNTIFHHTTLEQKTKQLRQLLSKTIGYVGISSFTDSGIEYEKEQYSQIIDEIYTRGLGYLELNADANQYIEMKALTTGAPYMKSTIELLDTQGNKTTFDDIEKIAKKNGYAIVIVPPYPQIIKDLSAWILKAGRVDYNIAPVSAIYDLPLHLGTTQIQEAH